MANRTYLTMLRQLWSKGCDTTSETQPRDACGARRRGMPLLGLLLVASCSRWAGEFPFVSSDVSRLGTKMLRPGTRARACRTRLLGQAATSAPMETVLGTLRGVDAESNGLLNLRVEVRVLSLGIVSRTCVTAVADVVRTTSVALVPAAGGESHGRPDR